MQPSQFLFEADRLSELLSYTLGLTGLTLLIALPLGGLLAVLLTRFPINSLSALWVMLLLALVIPLPLVAIAWQVVLGSWLPPLQLAPGTVAWRPWTQGLLPTAWIHAVAALPWVVAICSTALQCTDRELEDQAQLQGGGALFKLVLWPRLKLGWLASGLWIVVQTTTEIPITDAMMVRTFAEEVYTQFVSASDGLARAVRLNGAVTLVLAGVVLFGFLQLKNLPLHASLDLRASPLRGMSPRWRTGLSVVAWLIAGVAFGLPLLALVWKAGGADHRTNFDLSRLGFELQKVLRTDGLILLKSLGVAVSVGIATTSLGWWLVGMARSSRIFQLVLVLLGVSLAVLPGPILGMALKEAISWLVQVESHLLKSLSLTPDFPPLRSMLYDQPSPLPAMLACGLRFLPLALLLAAIAYRHIPQELQELARLDGLSSARRVQLLILPLTGGFMARCVLLISALTIGEVSASKLVNPPFYSNFILRLFDQMHYGADSTVAALGLLQLASSLLLVCLWLVLMTERDA